MAKRKLTRQQAKTSKKRAAAFVRRILQDEEHARSIEAEGLDEWAHRTRRVITNPNRRGAMNMANGATKADLQDMVDEAAGILAEAYDPLTTREDAMQAIADALDALDPDGETDSDDTDDSDDLDDSGDEDDS